MERTQIRTRRLKRGLVHVYTGDGKGKTTAALGLSMRAAGQGLHVYMIQLLKPSRLSSGEMKIAGRMGRGIKIRRLNTPWWSLKSFEREDDKARMRKILRKEFDDLQETILSRRYDIIIVDEIHNCLNYNLIDMDIIINLIKNRPVDVELVLTGRDAPNEIIAMADIVTEMKAIKHPYSKEIKARIGIEY
ncbi:MAG: cob(I)yrinic acid a,c-diamide adenosyltransferase [Nitrospinota bacterium]